MSPRPGSPAASVKWPPAPPTPQASCPQDLEQLPGGVTRVPKSRRTLGIWDWGALGSLGLGCLRELEGDVEVGDRVLVAILGQSMGGEGKGAQGWLGHGLRFRDLGSSRRGRS